MQNSGIAPVRCTCGGSFTVYCGVLLRMQRCNWHLAAALSFVAGFWYSKYSKATFQENRYGRTTAVFGRNGERNI